MADRPAPLRDLGARLARLESPVRLPGVDLARGLAVIGMFAAHVIVTPTLDWDSPSTWTGMVDGRSSILFATLAGLSLGLTVTPDGSQAGPPPHVARRRLAVRAALLWGLGIGLVTLGVPVNVILPAYGVLFVIAIALVALSTRSLVALALVVAVLMPFVVGAINAVGAGVGSENTDRLSVALGWHYPFLLWAAFLAAGIAAGRLLLASSAGALGALGLVVTGTTLAGIGYGVVGPIGNRAADDTSPDTGTWLLASLQDGPHTSGMGESLGSGGFALAAIGVCTLVGTTWLRWVLWPVRVLGSMPLTAYTGHLLVWAAWIALNWVGGVSFDPMDDFRALEPFWPLTLGVTAGCVLWAVLVGRGPLEVAVTRLSARLAGPGPS